jgi:hypothetical protein
MEGSAFLRGVLRLPTAPALPTAMAGDFGTSSPEGARAEITSFGPTSGGRFFAANLPSAKGGEINQPC